jgi:hypothetical protein
MYAPAAGLSQLRSMLVTGSVFPSRWTKIVFTPGTLEPWNLYSVAFAIAACAAARRATGTRNGDALT